MPLSREKLQKLLQRGETDAVVHFFRQTSEADRREVASLVLAWCRRLDLNWRAQFNKKAQAEVAQTGAIKHWDRLKPAAYIAALACADLKQLRSHELTRGGPLEATVAVLKDRQPAWRDEYAERLCDHELTRWSRGGWNLVRALVRAGLVRPPKHPNYVLGVLNDIWPPFDLPEHLRRQDRGLPPLPEPKLSELLLKHRDWLQTDFWRLFELDGNGEVSLANADKYSKSEETWTKGLVELSQQGVLARDRLLDASLAALARDFIQFRAGWFSRFHEALAPTPAERAARLESYLRLLASSIPPTVAFASNALTIVDEAQPLPAARLLGALPPVLAARGRGVVKAGLQLLDKVAGRQPAMRPQVCLTALPALLHEAAEVQKAVFDLLDRHGDKQDPELSAKLQELEAAVAASLRPRLSSWLGPKPPGGRIQPAAPTPTKVVRPVHRLDVARAIQPITDLDDLILAASAVLEAPDNPMDIERVLEGISRLCDQRPADFERRTGPLAKRALKKRDALRFGTHHAYSQLERVLAMLLLSWLQDQEAFVENPEKLANGQNQYAFLFGRFRQLGKRAAARQALPLLSAPTHLGYWIAPTVLVSRWRECQRAGVTPDLQDQVLALLRLAPECRAAALAGAKSLSGEAGLALRLALGEPQPLQRLCNPALALAALRSRQPHGDLPEFNKAYPRLGPDAGVGAQYSWQAAAKRHTLQTSTWTSFELAVKVAPGCPVQVDEALLPVLFHRLEQPFEDHVKPLLRYGMALWPANREALFARATKGLALAVDYADASDQDYPAYLEPVADPHCELRPMACLALALGLAAEDSALRAQAQDGLITAITDGRLPADLLGSTLARLLDTGINRFARWAKSLREVARVSSTHARVAAELLQRALHGEPAQAPRDLGVLLELLVELLSETGQALTDAKAREYLRSVPGGGKASKTAKQLLSLSSH